MSVWTTSTRKLDSVYDVNGRSLPVAYDLNGRVVFPDSELVAFKSYDISEGWLFNLVTNETGYTNTVDYTQLNYDDSAWTQVDVPYDWMIKQEFTSSSLGKAKGAWLEGGFGVFRRHL